MVVEVKFFFSPFVNVVFVNMNVFFMVGLGKLEMEGMLLEHKDLVLTPDECREGVWLCWWSGSRWNLWSETEDKIVNEWSCASLIQGVFWTAHSGGESHSPCNYNTSTDLKKYSYGKCSTHLPDNVNPVHILTYFVLEDHRNTLSKE